MSRFDPFRDWPKHGDRSGDPVYQAAGIMTDVAQILDVVRREWSEVGQWSDWDQSVRDKITTWLTANTTASAAAPSTEPDTGRGLREAREVIAELVAAMRRYERDVDGDQPQDHRDMMNRADQALAALSDTHETPDQKGGA